MRKKILITGGAGFIGSHLTDALLARGDRVVVLDNFNHFYSPKIKRLNLQFASKSSRFKLYDLDIRRIALKDIFLAERFDSVVHLAAMAGVRQSIKNPNLYADVNVVGTVNVLDAIRAALIPQLIFASSSSVYGNRSHGPFGESDRTDNQISVYGATKKSGELLCETYAKQFGIQTTVLRFFTVYGPRNRPDMACYKFLDSIFREKSILGYDIGASARDYTYVGDIIEGILAAIDKPFSFEIINLGNSSPIKIPVLIKTIGKAVGKSAKIKRLPRQPGDVSLTFADIRKAKRLLAFNPQVKLDSGVSKLVQWYVEKSQ